MTTDIIYNHRYIIIAIVLVAVYIAWLIYELKTAPMLNDDDDTPDWWRE